VPCHLDAPIRSAPAAAGHAGFLIAQRGHALSGYDRSEHSLRDPQHARLEPSWPVVLSEARPDRADETGAVAGHPALNAVVRQPAAAGCR
jgi:hypothetical protein